ncbi:MAG: PAS domain S-box protein [Candidatus Acidiferrales bacterium]
MRSSKDKSPIMARNGKSAPLKSILCTEELNRRPSRPPDYHKENRALVSLAQALADSPKTILQTLADTILEVLGVGTSGVSLLARDESAFYWPAVAGAWKEHVGGGTPRDFGPCGTVLDRNAPLMFQHAERHFTYLQTVAPPMEEAMLVPFYVAGKAVGTVWAIAHSERRKFDAEDLRQLVSLGRFASAAYQTINSLQLFERRGERLEQSQTVLTQQMAEIQKSSEGSRDSRRAALNLMEDAVRSRQDLEKLNIELGESEERYRTLFALSPVAIYTCDASGVVRDFNQRAAELWGRRPNLGDQYERFCGSSKLFTPEGVFVPHEQCPMVDVLSGKLPGVRDMEVQVERPDGSRITVIVNIAPLTNERGEIIGAVNCFVDITDRIKADAKLQKSEQTFHSIFDHSNDAIFIINPARDAIVDVNVKAWQLLGYSREELLSLPISAVHPGEMPALQEFAQSVARSGKGWTDTLTCLHKDGHLIPAEISASMIERDGSMCMIALVRDITERKHAEKARAQLAAIVESSDDAMVSETLDGTITSWNKGAERLFGYAAEEAIGQNITFIIPDDRLHEERTILELLNRGERVEHFETARKSKGGSLLDVSLTISLMKGTAGRIVGASKVARDITQQKRDRHALQEAHDRLEYLVEQRTAAVRKLSAEVIRSQDEERRRISRELHDSVGQYLSLAKMTVEELRNSTAPKKEAKALSQVSDILDKCLAEARTISHLLHPPLLDEVGLASAAHWYVEGFSKRSGIQVNLNVSEDLKRLPGMLEIVLFRILQESLTNVHRHAQTQSVDVQIQVGAGEVTLDVRDHGRGIPPQLLERFRSTGQGAGMGLVGMRERILELGGRFEIQSNKNGTLLRVAAPLSAGDSPDKAAAAGNHG